MSSDQTKDKRRADRYSLAEEIELSLEADALEASGVDVFQTGLSFCTKSPLAMKLRLKMGDEIEERRARMVWAVPLEDGSVRVGMKFIDEE